MSETKGFSSWFQNAKGRGKFMRGVHLLLRRPASILACALGTAAKNGYMHTAAAAVIIHCIQDRICSRETALLLPLSRSSSTGVLVQSCTINSTSTKTLKLSTTSELANHLSPKPPKPSQHPKATCLNLELPRVSSLRKMQNALSLSRG